MEWKTIQIGWVLMKKYWKRGFREDVRGLKQVSHKKPFKKPFLGVSRLGESRGSVAKIFMSREQAVSDSPKASRWTRDWGFVTGELPAEPRKTLTPIFQYRTWLNDEKQSKH